MAQASDNAATRAIAERLRRTSARVRAVSDQLEDDRTARDTEIFKAEDAGQTALWIAQQSGLDISTVTRILARRSMVG